MKEKNYPRRGDVFLADLGQTVGSEQSGLRPVVIIQNNTGNHFSPTIVIAPITAQEKKPLPVHVRLHHPELRRPSYALLEQIRVISKERLHRIICHLDRSDMQQIDKALRISLALQESGGHMTWKR